MGLLCRSIRALPRALAIAALSALLTSLPAEAGSMPGLWTSATDGDLAGYRVYYGTAPGSYTASIDVGKVTSATLVTLSDCTRYYVAIKAYDASGNQSAAFSNEVTGHPSTAITQVSPASVERGSSLTVTVSGANFGAGVSVSFSDPKITVLSTTLVSCNQMRAEIAIAPDAVLGAVAVDVTNTDRTFASHATALSVVDVTVPEGPTVVATTPAAGATSVPVTVQPTITFSAPMDAATISRTNVQLLLPDGTPVAQGSGSPTLDVTGKVARLMPAGSLLSTTSYRIQIVGGPGGSSDAQGRPLAETYLQPQPFTTEDAGDTTPPAVVSVTPRDGAMDIAVTVRPTITLSEPLE